MVWRRGSGISMSFHSTKSSRRRYRAGARASPSASGVEPSEAAAVDVHYLPAGHVSGTVILLEGFGWTEDDVPALLRSLDEDFLPDVDLERGTLSYTVVSGRVLASFEAVEEEKGR